MLLTCAIKGTKQKPIGIFALKNQPLRILADMSAIWRQHTINLLPKCCAISYVFDTERWAKRHYRELLLLKKAFVIQ